MGFQLPVGQNGKPYLPAEIVEMSFSSDEDDDDDDDDDPEDERNGGNNDEEASEEDATSETLVQEDSTHRYDLNAEY